MKLIPLVIALGAGSSWACSCRIPDEIYPRDGATNVPTNVVIRTRWNFTTVTLQRAADQQEIVLVAKPGPSGFLFSFFPGKKLEPNTQYMVRTGETTTSSFTTGAGEDTVAPGQPTLASSTYEYLPADSNCGDAKRWRLSITGGDDDSTPRDELLVLVHDGTTLVGATELSDPRLYVFACGTNFAPPSGSPMNLSVQVMDLAGNLSELSSSQQVRACSTGPGGVLMVLAVLFMRRRRS